MKRLVPLALVVLLLAAAPVRADEDLLTPGPALLLEHLDLLPLGEFERQDFRKEHPDLSKRLQGLASRIGALEKKVAKLGAKEADARKKLRAEIARLRTETAAPLAELRNALLPKGLTDGMIVQMGRAPMGAGRVERYSHQLVLLLEGLDPAQRTIFEHAIPSVDGAYLSAKALHDRTELALKQSGLEPREMRAVLSGFRRQTNIVESRFWRLVDYALEDDQKAALWEMLPTRMRRHASPQDHVFALPDLAPSQGARVKALIAEIEAETAPDQALVNRTKVALRDKSLSRKEREALAREQRDAYARMTDLRRFAYETSLEILTEAQIHAMKAIPPRVSMNDRRRNGKRVLEGLTFTAEQQTRLEALRKEGRVAGRQYQARMRELRKEGGEVGPDSPQQMMMEMMSASAQGEALTTQRHLLGRAFREILTLDQVTGWVMGLYGDRR